MQSFLEKLAAYLFKHYSDKISELCVVLPNRRAKLFLKNRLSLAFGKTIWAPQIFSIEDFIADLSGADTMDSLTATFEFYAVYQEIEKEKAQSFDEFLQWAPNLLNDFNEIDQYLVDAEALFDYLSDDRAYKVWNLDSKDLTDFQKSYLRFWKSLFNYYTAFTNYQHAGKMLSQGLAYRLVAENAVDFAKSKNWFKIIFAGFNALNTAERNIFKSLAEAGMADILWDADAYYVNDTNQEAGKFIRTFKESFGKYNAEKTFLWQENKLAETTKNIRIVGVAQQAGQAKVSGELLREIALKVDNKFKNHALVLADENLLMPVLHAIPEEVGKFNVTMGYSLRNLSLNSLFEAIFNLQENALNYSMNRSRGKARFYYKDLKKVLLHPSIELLLRKNQQDGIEKGSAGRNFIYYLEKQNQLFISYSELAQFFADNDFPEFNYIKSIFVPWQNSIQACLGALLEFLQELNSQSKQIADKIDAVELEIVFQYTKIIQRIQTLLEATSDASLLEVKTIRAVFSQLVNAQSIAFIGEPLEGLQIMGMLETRALDFETVILLSANEGVLPSAKKENSFIPLELKSRFGLPTYSEKDAIFAYHFYRLIQGAKEIYLVYNTETDEFGSGEKSRYITQLQQELQLVNKNVSISEMLYTVTLNPVAIENRIEIIKNDFVQKKLQVLIKNGLSPSLFNSYRNCSLQFYFKYIAGLKETEEPDESVDAATFGTVIHAVLEENLKGFVGKKVTSAALQKSFAGLTQQVEDAFSKEYKNGDLHSGKNLLNLRVAEKYLGTFLKEEINFIKELSDKNQTLQIIGLEQELSHPLTISGQAVLLKGKADRIDKIQDQIRIIDYKTGAVNERDELRLKSWDDLKNVKKNKSFQLLMYAYLFLKSQNQISQKISSGILSFRQLSSGLKLVSINGISDLNAEVIADFEMELVTIIEEILNPQKKFSQTIDEKICAYCAFNLICNK